MESAIKILEAQLNSLDELRKVEIQHYISIIEEISDASITLLMEALKYVENVETLRSYGSDEENLTSNILGYIDTTRNLSDQLTKINK